MMCCRRWLSDYTLGEGGYTRTGKLATRCAISFIPRSTAVPSVSAASVAPLHLNKDKTKKTNIVLKFGVAKAQFPLARETGTVPQYQRFQVCFCQHSDISNLLSPLSPVSPQSPQPLPCRQHWHPLLHCVASSSPPRPCATSPCNSPPLRPPPGTTSHLPPS